MNSLIQDWVYSEVTSYLNLFNKSYTLGKKLEGVVSSTDQQCLGAFLVVTAWPGEGGSAGTTGIQWEQTRDTAEHPATHRTASATRNLPAPNVVVPRLRNPKIDPLTKTCSPLRVRWKIKVYLLFFRPIHISYNVILQLFCVIPEFKNTQPLKVSHLLGE